VHGGGDSGLGLQHPGAGEQHVLEVELMPLVLEGLIALLQLDELLGVDTAGARPSAACFSIESIDTLRHSISDAMSRSVAVLGRRRIASAACPSIRTLLSMIEGAGDPARVGQKKFS